MSLCKKEETGVVCPWDSNNKNSKHNSAGKNERGKGGRMLRDSVTWKQQHLDGEMMDRSKE